MKKFEENPVLLLIPHLVLPAKEDVNADDKTTVLNPEIYNYFKEIDRLKK
jgi:hypothetical protein